MQVDPISIIEDDDIICRAVHEADDKCRYENGVWTLMPGAFSSDLNDPHDHYSLYSRAELKKIGFEPCDIPKFRTEKFVFYSEVRTVRELGYDVLHKPVARADTDWREIDPAHSEVIIDNNWENGLKREKRNVLIDLFSKEECFD